jgi:predicted ABC-type ATPase/uncharacterized protein YuzE
MELNFTPINGKIFIKLSESAKAATTMKISDGIHLEYDFNGSIVGIYIDNIVKRTDLAGLKELLRINKFIGDYNQQGEKQKLQVSNKIAEPSSAYIVSNNAGLAPHIILICGPNGAGKSTTAPDILKGALGVDEFVNADTIAQGISAFKPEKAAIKAGRIMLTRLRELAKENLSFAFETTLSSRSFAPWIKDLKQNGYRVSVLFFWLESTQLAINRVAERVLHGGHNVAKDVIIRRYEAGLANFFRVYRPLADHWKFYNNSGVFTPALIASGSLDEHKIVLKPDVWRLLVEKYLK